MHYCLEDIPINHIQDEHQYKTAGLAAKLADSIVSASYLPDLWHRYYEGFHGVLSAEGGVL